MKLRPDRPDARGGAGVAARWAAVASELRSAAAATLGPGGRVVSPDCPSMTPSDRAGVYVEVLQAVYAGAHRRSALDAAAVVALQESARLRLWVVTLGDDPVGVVGMSFASGVATLGVVAKHRPGTRLPSGRVYGGELRVGAAVWHAVAETLGDPVTAAGLWCLSTEIRLAAERRLPCGRVVPAGVGVHAVVDRAGFVPFLYTAPYPNRRWAEFFLWSRLYLMPEAVEQGPLYVPETPGGTRLRELATTSYCRAWGRAPAFGDVAGAREPASVARSDVFSDGVVTLVCAGDLDVARLRDTVAAALDERPFCLAVTENRPANLGVLRAFDELGLVPVGVWPGGDFETAAGRHSPPTLFVYATGRPDAVADATPILLGTTYRETAVGRHVVSLHDAWTAGARGRPQ